MTYLITLMLSALTVFLTLSITVSYGHAHHWHWLAYIGLLVGVIAALAVWAAYEIRRAL